jgi:site-specific recombinase XerD
MDKTSVSLSQYFKLYELALSYEGKTPKTLDIYLRNLERFERHLAHELQHEPSLLDFTPDAVMDYIMALKTGQRYQDHPYKTPSGKPISAATLDQHVRTLKGFATWLREKRHTRTNLLQDLPRPKLPTLVVEPLTDEEIKRILASINTRTLNGARNYAILVVLLDTGLRLGELCGLTLEDVHLEGKHCYLKVMGKGRRERIVYLGRRGHEALLTYQTFVRPHYEHSQIVQHFFLSELGDPISPGAVQHMMAKVGKGAGVPRLHPHLLRHTAATQYLVHGGDVISLQRKLGHAGLEMTNRYVHFAAQELAAIQERVSPMDKLDIKPMRVPKAT